MYKDIIQVDVIEDYYNLTVKSVAILRWIALNCPFVRFLFKLDDDSFVRVNPLINMINQTKSNSIYGKWSGISMSFHQKPTDKWFISYKDYPHYFYPTYAAGLYLVPGPLTIKLYECIVQEPLGDTIPALPFEDAYITGILAQKSKIFRRNMKKQLFLENIDFNLTLKYSEYFLLWNIKNLNNILKFWNIFGAN